MMDFSFSGVFRSRLEVTLKYMLWSKSSYWGNTAGWNIKEDRIAKHSRL